MRAPKRIINIRDSETVAFFSSTDNIISFVCGVLRAIHKFVVREYQSEIFVLTLFFSSSSLNTAISTLLSAGMFAIQTDDHRRGFRVTRGVSFYLVVVDVALTILLAVMSLYDLMFSRRAGGDPTTLPDIAGSRAITYDNPGYRDNHNRKLNNVQFNHTMNTCI